MDPEDREQHDQFLRLFLENEDSLKLFVRSLLYNQEEARDVMQEIAIVLWRKYDPSLDGPAFRRWAFGVARMEVLAFRRDRARDRHTFGEDLVKLLEQSSLENSDSLEDERHALEACVAKLPTDQRQLVRSAYEPRTKINLLAQNLGCTPMTLYKKLHRIRLQLIECTRRQLTMENSP